MANGDTSAGVDWQVLAGRFLALVCLRSEGLRDSPAVDQWLFLEKLGFPRDDAAVILGTSTDALRVGSSRRKAKKPATETAKKAQTARKR
jgi:hypothetical protein